MKNALIILFSIFATIASATDHYISLSGYDTNNGLSISAPWKTIAKVNSSFSIIKPGDRILFKRGDTFYGTINVAGSGSAGSPITLGAYGTGANPIITGFTTISGWTNEGNGIYSKVITAESQTNMVTIDGVSIGMGRYPNTTYLTYESFSTNVSITDNGLGDANNWTGAEAVIRKNDFTLDRCLITDRTGGILTYTNLGTTQNATANYGYFIQNDLRCVTNYGEWYHDTSKGRFYMYFGAVDPTTKIVKVATIKNLLYNNLQSIYITVDNLSFVGSIGNSIDFGWITDHCIIQSCSVSFAGLDGIKLLGGYDTIDNNYITDCHRTGIRSTGPNVTITNNTLSNIGIIEGQSDSGKSNIGIFIGNSGCLLQYNRIENVGYSGIYLSALIQNVTVQNNYINRTCLILNDGGGIYTDKQHSFLIIDGNIILNTVGNNYGTPNNTVLAEGIYLDEYSSNVTVRNNTIANCSYSGIKLHKAHNNIIENNTLFNNYTGIYFLNLSGSNTIYGNTINGNILFAKASTQYALRFSSSTNDISSFGSANNNYYARPIDDNYVFYTNQPSTGPKNRTLKEWQSFTNQDLNSHKSAIAITNNNEIRFEYNVSKTNKVITLEQPMIDVKGTKYVNSLTLLPYTSVVLMIDPNPAPPAIPVYTGSVIENTTPSLLEITYDVSLFNITPPASVFTVQVNSIVRTVNSVAISGTKVILTLASPIVYGDVVTVSYTKPSSNPLQSTSTGITASIRNQPVVNYCINVAPTATITSPISNSSFTSNANITITAIATDPDGLISIVEFYSGNTKIGTKSATPYSFTWNNVAAGIYSLTAVATDNLNATTTSIPIVFEVGTAIMYDANSNIINLYPNPNNGHFSIEFILPFQNEKSKITITDLAGKQVYNALISKEETLKQFDLSNIRSGIYILLIKDEEILFTKKFIIL